MTQAAALLGRVRAVRRIDRFGCSVERELPVGGDGIELEPHAIQGRRSAVAPHPSRRVIADAVGHRVVHVPAREELVIAAAPERVLKRA